MIEKINVLVLPGGTEIGLEIFKSLQYCKDIELFSGGQNISNHAPYVFDKHFVISSVRSDNWLSQLDLIVQDNQINYIYPAHDDVIVALAQNASQIKAKIVTSPLKTCLTTRSKLSTYKFLKNVLAVPKVYSDYREIEEFPVFVKPDRGQGSQYSYLVKSKGMLLQLLEKNNKEYIILEYLPYEEYTVDCFSDREKGLLFCNARQRIRTKSGISMATKSIETEQEVFRSYAEIISSYFSFYGAWFFQMKQDKTGEYKLLEIAPRIAGTSALQRVRGVNLPLLSLYEQKRVPTEIIFNNLELTLDRALINRYEEKVNYQEVYVDFDDTLIFEEKVNTNLIKFLFQCLNNRIKITLITKHSKDLNQTLNNYRLAGLFDEVLHLKQEDQKYKYIKNTNSIFIDDSFRERKLVTEKLGILTFDSNMIEVLLKEKF